MMDASPIGVWHALVLNDNVHVVIQVARKLHLHRTVHSQHCQCEACMHNRATVAQSFVVYMAHCARPESVHVKLTGVCTIQFCTVPFCTANFAPSHFAPSNAHACCDQLDT